ncbi:MAG: hypothetical protein H0X02_06655 [Nitrosomonas sp.]|nr:hypothetical protein [Nitrosomonas sp.]
MDTTKTKLFFYKLRGICSRRYPRPSSLTLLGNKGLLLLLLTVLLFSGCKTVPIQDRYVTEKGGFWEQAENTGSRFHHNAIADDETIGLMYASGKSALLNGAQVENSSKIKNNAFVSTGPQSGARIAFKAFDSACLIRVDELNIGKAYADTSDCQQSIKTIHAIIEAKNAILHINVSQHQTEVMVISGAIEIILRENPTQSTNVKADQAIIITHNAIGRPRSITQDEIWQRILWRDDFRLYKTVVDWNKVIAGAVTVAIIAAAILFSKGRSGGGHGSGFPRHR